MRGEQRHGRGGGAHQGISTYLHISTIISTISTHQGLPQEEGPSHHRQLRLQAPLPRHLRGHARLHDARHRQVYLIYISTLISTTLSTQAVYRRPDQLYRGRSAGRHTGPLLLDTLHLQRARQVGAIVYKYFHAYLQIFLQDYKYLHAV